MIALTVTCTIDQVELAADRLWSAGVLAVEELDFGDGFVGLRTSLGDDRATTGLAAAVALRWPVELCEVDPAVAHRWREFAQPTMVDDLTIVPGWTDETTWPATGTCVAIDPGATFGMGDHPTTIAAIRALRPWLRPGASVLDVGCGSGILAVIACVLGAGSAHGLDISEGAVSATLANAARNGVLSRISASTEPLASFTGRFDLVVANILAPVLVELASDLRRVLAPQGTLVISGLMQGRHEHVIDALHPLAVVEETVVEGWVALTARP
jgi:ribosomal protein L11 methyltransferase